MEKDLQNKNHTIDYLTQQLIYKTPVVKTVSNLLEFD